MGGLSRDVEQNREIITTFYWCECHGIATDKPRYKHQKDIGYVVNYA